MVVVVWCESVPISGGGGVVDSVGAGDSFNGGLLYGVLRLRDELESGRWCEGEHSDLKLIKRLVGFANAVAAVKCGGERYRSAEASDRTARHQIARALFAVM